MIEARVIADSISPQGDRLTTFILTFPRIILAEFNTHRMFSRNSASSRAIPFEKMVKSVEENPFIPIAWQKDHKGMQGTEYFNDAEAYWNKDKWLKARDYAVKQATLLHKDSVTKQLCNRLLEPFMWHTVIITSGKEGLENFFDLRCPIYGDSIYGLDKCSITFKSKKDYCKYFNITENYQTKEQWYSHNYSQAEIHIQDLAEAMYDVYNESTPKKLQAGEWHIPFSDNIDDKELCVLISDLGLLHDVHENYCKVKIATARCARVSYTVVGEEGKEPNYENDIKLHDKLLESGHFSPFEHCAKAMSDEEYYSYSRGRLLVDNKDGYYTIEGPSIDAEFGWCNNFKGFIPYRYLIDKK